MAEERRANKIIRLSPEAKRRLTDLDADIEAADKAVEVLKSLGMDVTPIEEKIAWSKDVRKTLLTEFTD